MGSPWLSRRRLAAAISSVILLTIVLLARATAPTLYHAYSRYRTIERRLPDLPPVTRAPPKPRPHFPTKVWLHRVNSVERARLMAKAYRGLEVDVVYDTAAGYFDVGHPPVPSVGLSLDDIFSSLPEVGRHYFWLDFKNLNDGDKDAACDRLTRLAGRYGIVHQVIVESANPRALSCFAEHGFYTSYYLFQDTDLARMSSSQVADYYRVVKADLLASKVNALSASYESLPFIERYFPGMDVLLWYLNESGRRLGNQAMVTYLARKDRVKVILVHQWSPGFR